MTDTDTTNEATATRKGVGEPVDAPEDVADDARTGYAVYDRTLARYVTEVSTGKPSAKDANAAANGHPHKIVAV